MDFFRLDASSSNVRLFKGPEGTKIPVSDLKKIKVDIRRNIDAPEKTNELQRNILDPEAVVLKRREGNLCDYFYYFFKTSKICI